GRLRCRDHGHTDAAGIVEHVTGADGRDDFAKLDPAEFPHARNQLELLDRLFPRKTTVGAPNQRQRFVELPPRWRRRSSKPRHDGRVLPMHTSSKKGKAMACRIVISFAAVAMGIS